MKHLVEFPLEDGSSIVVELNEPETGGPVHVARGDKIDRSRETFEEAINKVLPVVKSFVGRLRSMDSKPDEIEVIFGINLSTVAGAFIASASAEANFGVTLHWYGTTQEHTLTWHSIHGWCNHFPQTRCTSHRATRPGLLPSLNDHDRSRCVAPKGDPIYVQFHHRPLMRYDFHQATRIVLGCGHHRYAHDTPRHGDLL